MLTVYRSQYILTPKEAVPELMRFVAEIRRWGLFISSTTVHLGMFLTKYDEISFVSVLLFYPVAIIPHMRCTQYHVMSLVPEEQTGKSRKFLKSNVVTDIEWQ